MDFSNALVPTSDAPERSSKGPAGSVGGSVRKTSTGDGLDDAEDVRCPLADVFIVRPCRLTWFHRQRRARGIQQLDGPFVDADDRLSRVVRTRVDLQHVLHPSDERLIDLGNAPHFFPAKASSHAWRGPSELSRDLSYRRCVFDWFPEPAIAASIAIGRSAAVRRPAPPPQLPDRCRASVPVLAVGLPSARAAARLVDSASRRARSHAGSRRRRSPWPAPCALRPATATPGSVARLEPSAPFGPAAFSAARSDLPATAANPRIASSSSPYAIDQTSIRSARTL
jgi:hypothetical protein